MDKLERERLRKDIEINSIIDEQILDIVEQSK